MANAGADIIVAHMGLTTGGLIGAETSLTLDACVERIEAIAQAAMDVRSDIIVLCHGGPITEPADAAWVLGKARHCHGFYGASSMERLPSEKAMAQQAHAFKQITFHPQ
jgi:predicted TIM-barrel enzyme